MIIKKMISGTKIINSNNIGSLFESAIADSFNIAMIAVEIKPTVPDSATVFFNSSTSPFCKKVSSGNSCLNIILFSK